MSARKGIEGRTVWLRILKAVEFMIATVLPSRMH